MIMLMPFSEGFQTFSIELYQFCTTQPYVRRYVRTVKLDLDPPRPILLLPHILLKFSFHPLPSIFSSFQAFCYLAVHHYCTLLCRMCCWYGLFILIIFDITICMRWSRKQCFYIILGLVFFAFILLSSFVLL